MKQKKQGLTMERSQKRYLYRFFSAHKGSFLLIVTLLFLQAFFEAVLPVWGRTYVRDSAALLDKDIMAVALSALILALIIYFVIAFFSIKFSRQLLVNLLNRFREDWFRNYLNRSQAIDNQSTFLTKITYHFSLVQMGFTQTFVNLLYLVMMFGVLVALLPHVVSHAVFLLLFFALLYLGIILLGRFVAFRFISKEQTLTTHIIRHAVDSTHNTPFIRTHNLQWEALKKLQKFVELDTYFRVRRGTWMSFANRVLFGIILFSIGIFYIVSIYFPATTTLFSEDLVVSGIVFALFVRLLYSSLNIGLFSVPLMLGLKLSTPLKTKPLSKRKPLERGQLIFHSKKVRLNKKEGYRKDVKLFLGNAQRLAIRVKNFAEADMLTKILAGKAGKKGAPWLVQVDGHRYTYAEWAHSFIVPTHIDPQFYPSATVGEIITGKDSSQIDEAMISHILHTFQDHPAFSFLFDLKKTLATEFRPETFTFAQKGLLQIAHALFTQPPFIVVDHLWICIQHPEILDALDFLFLKASESTIVTVGSPQESGLPERLNFTLLSL